MRCFPLVSPEGRLHPGRLQWTLSLQWGDNLQTFLLHNQVSSPTRNLLIFGVALSVRAPVWLPAAGSVHWCWFCLLWTGNYRLACLALFLLCLPGGFLGSKEEPAAASWALWAWGSLLSAGVFWGLLCSAWALFALCCRCCKWVLLWPLLLLTGDLIIAKLKMHLQGKCLSL